MAKTITISSKNRMIPGPSGMGAKVVQGHFSMLASDNALHHNDVELNTITALFIEQAGIGTTNPLILVDLVAPGTYNNLASLNAFNINVGGTPRPITGTAPLKGRFIAFGE